MRATYSTSGAIVLVWAVSGLTLAVAARAQRGPRVEFAIEQPSLSKALLEYSTQVDRDTRVNIAKV
jgi:hypothetical protein